MNKTLLKSPLIGLRTATFALLSLVLGYGVPYEVYRYHRDTKVELPKMLPELSDIDVEVYSPVQEVEQPVQRPKRQVWRQTAGRKFSDVFSSYYSSYKYTEGQLNTLCTKYNYIIFRNWCKEAKFELKEE